MDDELLAVRVAQLYYEHDKTQDEIGAQLGISRFKAGRMLTQARERGIVRIEVVHPRARLAALERALCDRFGLRDAVIVREAVPQAAADYLALLRPATLGVSWGRTLEAIAERLPAGWTTGVTVVQINGAMSSSQRADVTASIAERGAGTAVRLASPAILEQVETKRAIEADRSVADVLARAGAASAYLYSAGVADATSVLVDSGYLSAGDVAGLVRRGAVGDVLGRYIDSAGNIVDPDLDARTVGLGLDQLRSASTAIFAVAGGAKHGVARAVVTSGLCTVLVSDESTARALLEEK
jgi:deoxyribonucleoside regulator